MVEVSKERKNRYGHSLVRLSGDGEKRFKQLLKNLNRTINQ
ncbi:hypothetical protein ACT3TS_18555 [Specibacter sp. AOP5-B1-6]